MIRVPDLVDVFSAHQADSEIRPTWNPATTAVLVIDMVNDFCTDGGAMVLPGSSRIYPTIRALTLGARDAGATVVWVRDEHDQGDREFRKRTPHCLSGSWGAQIVEDLAPPPQDMVRTKQAFSAFYGTDLHDWLSGRGVATIILSGVVTNICVRSTAHDAFFHGYDVLVASDACAATGPREQESSLYDLATHFATVASTEAILAGGTK